MLLEFFASYKNWILRLSSSISTILVVFSILMGAVLVGVSFLLPPQSVGAVTAGSIAGLLWVLGTTASWWLFVPKSIQDKYNFREKIPFKKRRTLMFYIGGAWLLTLFISGQSVDGALWVFLGALNVVILVNLAHFGFATQEEREEWTQEEEERELRKLYQKAYEEGLINEDGEIIQVPDSVKEKPNLIFPKGLSFKKPKA